MMHEDEGQTIEALWNERGRSLPTKTVLTLVSTVLDILVASHRDGVVHGSLKASSVLFTKTGRIKLLHFGTVEVTDPQADLSALGTMMFQLLYGKAAPADADPRLIMFIDRALGGFDSAADMKMALTNLSRALAIHSRPNVVSDTETMAVEAPSSPMSEKTRVERRVVATTAISVPPPAPPVVVAARNNNMHGFVAAIGLTLLVVISVLLLHPPQNSGGMGQGSTRVGARPSAAIL